MGRRNYLNFTTPYGIELTSAAKSGLASFLIHECGYLPALNGWNHEGVDSPFWRFYHNPTPGCSVRFSKIEIPLLPNNAIIIPAYTVFDCVGPTSAEHFWIHFTLPRHGQVLLDKPAVIQVDEALRGLLASTIALHTKPASELRTQQLYHSTAAVLHLGFSKITSPLTPGVPDALADLLAVIHGSPHSDLSNSYLAERSRMSVEKFIRWFHAHLGDTPAAYVSRIRTKMASESLALTDKSIDQIAAEFGFPNRSYFSRVFAKEVGCGPAEFRKRQRDKRGL
jgi:AraC family transcriptional regulator, arabinose operon regulatory protein